ncbi:unnamed protein product [Chondrus crispus]|uniref:Uncharacterized protein n=1 Tax=Chondrus crispus TaxID=2769 RepID=R7QEU4_CHOCR|nr:unnamed protein product [Chondrus crispus]CDF36308.1 unnamed protein product [Chondrus crispus]|eukprot:XP_005716127.1 unnamed protein product [Chondrus crispus]
MDVSVHLIGPFNTFLNSMMAHTELK